MARTLINTVRLADATDTGGVTVTAVVWEAEVAEDGVSTGTVLTFYYDPGTSDADAQSQMDGADTAENPPADPIEAAEPKWQYNTETKEYCVFGADGIKLFAIKRDADGRSILTMFDTAGSPVVPGWIDLVRQGTNQNPIYTDTDILMSKAAGTLDYDSATGVVTIKGGRLYRMFATFSFASMQGGKKVRVEWVKASDNTPLSSMAHKTQIIGVTSASDSSSGDSIEIIYQPVLDVGVKLRCTLYGGTNNAIMNKDSSMATIVEIR